MKTVVSKAIDMVKRKFPAYFLDYRKELDSALEGMEQTKFPLTNLIDVYKNHVPKNIKDSFNQSNAYSHIGKVVQSMRRMVSFLLVINLS